VEVGSTLTTVTSASPDTVNDYYLLMFVHVVSSATAGLVIVWYTLNYKNPFSVGSSSLLVLYLIGAKSMNTSYSAGKTYFLPY